MTDRTYQVFTRKWRPKTFDDIIGQEQAVLPLRRAIEQRRVMHAYLFSGPRGVGKTTTARVLAMALNCENGPAVTYDPDSEICREIADGSSLDVIEIDGASNRGIEEIRQLRENIGFAPAKGRYKVYIIDEVHMLTKEAFNALLKTLEEPPRHVIFVFATTDPQNIPPTILSRCQHFRFRRMPVELIVENLKKIAAGEKIAAEEEAYYAIAKAADGALRDAQRLFDQAVTFSKGGRVTANAVNSMIGEIQTDILRDLAAAIADKDIKKALMTAGKVISEGFDIQRVLFDLVAIYRNVLVISAVNEKGMVAAGEEEFIFLSSLAAKTGRDRVVSVLQKAVAAEQAVTRSRMPGIIFETFLSDAILSALPQAAPQPDATTPPPQEQTAPKQEKAPAAPETAEEIKQDARPAQPMIIESIEEEEQVTALTKEIIEKRWVNVAERARGLKGLENADEVEQFVRAAVVVKFDDPVLFIIGDNPFVTSQMKKHIDVIKQMARDEFKQELKINIFEKAEYDRKFNLEKSVTEEEARNNPAVKGLIKILGEPKEIKVKRQEKKERGQL